MILLFTKRVRAQEENKAINRRSLRWCSAPTEIPEQLGVCQSTFPFLISLSPLTQFKSECSFPQFFLPAALPAFHCPFICLFNHTFLHWLSLLTALLSIFLPDSFIPPVFLYSSSISASPPPASQKSSCMAYQDSKEALSMPQGKEAITASTPVTLHKIRFLPALLE